MANADELIDRRAVKCEVGARAILELLDYTWLLHAAWQAPVLWHAYSDSTRCG